MHKLALAACFGMLFSSGAMAAAGDLWITNVKLVSPEKLDRVEPGSVLVRDGRIVAVSRGARQAKPAGSRLFDGGCQYLTPGLIDSHVHLHGVPGMSMEQPRSMPALATAYFRQLPRSFLYFGYTTVVDLALAERKVIDDFQAAPLHPDLVHCGEPLVFANGYPSNYAAPAVRFDTFRNFIYDPAQAASIPARFLAADYTAAKGVERAKLAGGACVKTHYEHGFGGQKKLPVMSAAVYADVREAASAQGMTLVTHANSFEGQQFAVAGRADVLAHGMWHWGSLNGSKELPAEIKTLLDRVVERKTGYQATMQVLYGLRTYFDPDYLKSPQVRKVVPGALANWFGTEEGKWFKAEVAEDGGDAEVLAGFESPLRRARQVVAYLAARDANFLLGSDTPSSPTYGNLPGLNGYLEMQRLHEAGLSLAQVFRAATISNARAFNIDGQVGTIEVGKRANLLLMKQSPLESIAAYDSIGTVWVGGRQVARAALAAD